MTQRMLVEARGHVGNANPFMTVPLAGPKAGSRPRMVVAYPPLGTAQLILRRTGDSEKRKGRRSGFSGSHVIYDLCGLFDIGPPIAAVHPRIEQRTRRRQQIRAAVECPLKVSTG